MSVSFTVGTALGGAAGWGAVSTSLTLFAGRNVIVAISKDNQGAGTLTVDGVAAMQLAAGHGVYFYEAESESGGSASIVFNAGGGVNSWGMVAIGVAGADTGIDDSFSGSASTDGSGSGTVASGLDVPSGGAGLFVPYGPANVDMSANVGSELWSNFGEASDDYVSFAAYEADETFSSVTVTGPQWDTVYVGGIAFTASGGGGGVTGTLDATEGADTASFAGTVTVQGTISATEAADTVSLAGQVLVQGTLAATEQADTAEFEGAVPVRGSLAATEGADSASFAGNVAVHGALGASEGADTAAFEGTVPVTGTFAATENADTAAFAGKVLIQGSLAATEASDTAAFSGSQVLTGTLAATEVSDSASFSGKVVVAGALAASEEVDSASFAGTVRIGGTLGATESADGAAFGGLVLIQGGLSATEGADTAAFTSRPYVASARRSAASLRPSRTRASLAPSRVAASQR